MPSQIEGMIQNMIQAGIPHAQMMQFLQQSLHQATGASPSPAINHNNIGGGGGGQSSAAQQAAAAVVAVHQAAQAAAHQQHFQQAPPQSASSGHPQQPHPSSASSAISAVQQNTGGAPGVGPTGGGGGTGGIGQGQQQQHAASNGGGGGGATAMAAAGVAAAAAASLQHLASLQQQQQLLAAHHQHQHQHNPAVGVAASAAAAHSAIGQPSLQASSLMQMATGHPHHQPSAGLAAMQQQLQQTAAAGATHPMAAAFAQAQLAAAAAQQQQHGTGGATGAGLSTGLSGVGAANLQQHQVQQLASNVAQNAAAAQQTAPSLAIPSLAWPIFQPIVNIPYFDMATYQKVNLDVQPSAMANGMDLPLNDINTLRFFFNFGVQHARAILLRQHINSQAANQQQQQQQQQHQQHQLALLQQQNQLAGNANNGAQQGSQELNSANEQLQMQQKLLVHQSLLKAQNDAAVVAAAAAAIEKSTGNSVSNAAGSGAAQLLQGGMAGLAGLQNPLQMNQLAAMMANQQGAGQQTKIGNLGVNTGEMADLGAGGASAVAQQLRMVQQSNNPQQAQLAAMQQLLMQQQQQQLAAALAQQQQQQQQEQDQQQSQQQQTGNNDLGRNQLITSSVGGTPTNSTPSTQMQNNQSGGQFAINGNGGGSANGTPQSATGGGGGGNNNNGGRGSVNGQQMTNSVSPKNGAVVPTDPAPRKPPSAQIMANPLNAELNDLKQRGLNALRSPEAMNEGLQKRIVEMANTLNNTVSMGTVAVGGGGNGGGGAGNGSSGGIISLGGGPGGCAGAQLPPAILLQQQQQIYQQQQQLLQQHLLQQQLLQAQQNGTQQPPQTQQQQISMAAQLSAALANNFVTPNGGISQQQRQNALQQNIHSAENDTAPALLSATEMHYTETFKNNQQQDGMKKMKQIRSNAEMSSGMAPELEIGAGLSQRRKSGVYMLNNMNVKEERKTPMTGSGGQSQSANSNAPTTVGPTQNTAVSTSAMMNFMNNMLTTAKSHLQGQGLGLYYDQNGNPIDYSSRPIDPIFRKAREDLSHSPGATASVSAGGGGGTIGQAMAATTTNVQPTSMAQIPAETQTTSAVGGDLGFLSRTCLIGISNDGRRGSVGNAQQLTAQQPVPLNALYPGNLTPQQLQQHYLQLQQQQQQLQQLQQIQQLQQQIQQQEQFQQGAIDSAENGKKRTLEGEEGGGGPSTKSARTVDSDIEIVQEMYTKRAESSNQADNQVGTPHQPPSSSAGPNVGQHQINIPPFTAPNELNNVTVIDSGTIGGGGGGEGNQQQQQGMEREEEDEMRASGQNEAAQQQQDREDEDGSPASGKQLRIAEEEEDGP